jgi:putative hydrolase of the HAD superfamily
MINAVLFDLFETLITEYWTHPTRASSLAATLELENDAYRVEWKARRARIVLGQVSFAEALTEICQTLTGSADTGAIQRVCKQRVREKAAAYARIDDEVTALITDLARRGIGLAVISNGFEEDVRPWSHCSLAREFQCTVFSCVEGVAKPDPEIYLRAVRRLGVQPATAVYVGDGADDELGGAERAGVRAYRAAWFVRRPPQKVPWPELTDREDVLKSVAAG